MNSIEGKTVLITGASKGIGEALACAFAAEGANLCLHGRNADALAALCKKLTDVRAEYIAADLMDPAAPREIVKGCAEKFGGIDILINSAGFMERTRVEDTSFESLDRHMKVNVYAPFFICQEAIPYLKKSDVSAVFNMCSIVSTKAYENQAAYTVTKHALYGLTKVMSREEYADGIRVYAVEPGLVSTKMSRAARPEVALSDMTSPEDLAEWLVFMATHRNTAIVDEIVVRRPGKKAFE